MDRNISGIIAGIAGGIVMNIWSFFSYHILDFAQLRFVDWSSVLIFGQKANSLPYLLVSLAAQLVWSGFLGALFAHAIPLISSKGYLIKGAFYGFVTSFIIYATPALFKHPIIKEVSLGTAITDMSGGVIWGITTIIVLRYLNVRYTTTS